MPTAEPLKAKCPICKRPTTQGEDYFPFCSERCQTVDLGAWSSEEYRIPGPSVHSNLEEDLEDEGSDR